ncbi:hypothetical protein SR38_03945 [Atlantibacter hermannii]|nr:hypothetical protein SR38_03945 [Atlantibacter hermannii]
MLCDSEEMTVERHAALSRIVEQLTPPNLLALVEALESAQRTIAELESDKRLLRPVGVMSESRFRALENRESRFIALWPRPGIYLPRKRPDDGVIVYARTGIKCELKGE